MSKNKTLSDAVALKVYLDGAEAFRCRLPIRTRPVRWMYRWINSRHLSGEGEARPTNISLPDNAPYGVDSMKKLVFLHGANVSESDDRNAESFRVGAQKHAAARGSSSSVHAEEGGVGR